METRQLIKSWFDKWESGDFLNLPVSDSFKHTSPYGVIEGKEAYINLVEANKDKFLGHRFDIHDALYQDNRACVRYTGIKEDFKLDVSEWYIIKDGLIDEIIAYYNIEGEISEARKLDGLDN